MPYYRPAEDSLEMKYLRKRREALGGPVPARRSVAQELKIPSLDAFAGQLKSTNDREISTTMAFVRMLTTLCKDKEIGHRIVPIVPDEARTFGMASQKPVHSLHGWRQQCLTALMITH